MAEHYDRPDQPPHDAPYRDPARPIPERVDDLLSRMTLVEKVRQLGCVWSTQLVVDDEVSDEKLDELLGLGTGQVTRIAASTGLEAEGLAAFHNQIQRHLVTRTHLGIPAVIHEESTAGFCARGATQFPQAIGLAATWDPDLVGEIGEVITTSDCVMTGYLNNPEANEKMFTPDGWCRTGDVVRLEADGNIFYCDRDKDALKVGGENVSAREVEDVCRTVAGIDDIAVVAKSHEMLDMVPVAFVIRNAAAPPEDEMGPAIIEACRVNLADFKVPRAVYFVDEFPTAELGKISKKELREIADGYPAV